MLKILKIHNIHFSILVRKYRDSYYNPRHYFVKIVEIDSKISNVIPNPISIIWQL